jgi:phosphatidylserine/phosphatidylglycerophosphate/cardiolipin synthase-like enzyme
MRLCLNARHSVRLCSPFVKKNIIDEVMASKYPGALLELITNVNLRNFHPKASDVEALDRILTGGGGIYNCTALHAKIYIFDDEKLIVTSSNLTLNGLKQNVECSIITDDIDLVNKAVAFYRSTAAKKMLVKLRARPRGKLSRHWASRLYLAWTIFEIMGCGK